MRSVSPIFIALAVILVAESALANQASQLTTSLNRSVLGAKDCSSSYSFEIKATRNGLPAQDLSGGWKLTVASTSDCSGGTSLSKTPSQSAEEGTYIATFTGGELFEASTGQACPGVGIVKTAYVCAHWENEGGNTIKSGAKLEIGTSGPGRPELNSVKPGDQSLHLSFQPAGGATSPSQWEVCYRVSDRQELASLELGLEEGEAGAGGSEPGAGGAGGEEDGEGGAGGDDEGEGGSGGGDGGEAGAGGAGPGDDGPGEVTEFSADRCAGKFSGIKRSYRLTDLENGTTYEVAVRAIDDKGNESEFSGVGFGTPVPVDDFWDRYKEAGGQQQGCSTSTGAAALALPMVLFILLTASRRREGR